jgi:hypothetical protein
MRERRAPEPKSLLPEEKAERAGKGPPSLDFTGQIR